MEYLSSEVLLLKGVLLVIFNVYFKTYLETKKLHFLCLITVVSLNKQGGDLNKKIL